MTSAYASPASSFADSIERAAAGARFSSVGRQLLGPRLPVAIDWNDPPPELWYVAYVAGKTLLNVVEAHGGVPRGVLGVLGVNVYVFCKVRRTTAAMRRRRRRRRDRRTRDPSSSNIIVDRTIYHPTRRPRIDPSLMTLTPPPPPPPPLPPPPRPPPPSVQPGGVLFGDVCLNPYAVLHMNQLERVVTSAFVHRDLFHLLNNMTGLGAFSVFSHCTVEDGSYVESRDGVGSFLAQTALLLVLSQGALVTLSWAERKLTGRGGSRGASGWIDDALGGLTTTTTTTTRRSGGGGAETLPFYSSGVVGFSGVNYALKVVASHRRPLGSRVLLLGVLPVPARYSFWCELALNTLLMPSSGTFAAHFAGCVAGLGA
ncbi:uncharacterized protein MICPUCDRAFT_54609 [Micromonas pusilla CCMP1545]|uniref:Predicted protein n=1 Tax=Micromonas pusilla (strain CCMP1545) TaxID=564608 RepID=C1N9S6_MICPC|nr:uncharacterized protein MICPUCDRAFT_54609 [Micromonas pusilla CCMP1545]EEH51120.1 predicted protein [Micromonas pusilla CCMP1545]|eukprot:XP_003064786.1 predicted protein [Micromonas pusilla CCMP1545]